MLGVSARPMVHPPEPPIKIVNDVLRERKAMIGEHARAVTVLLGAAHMLIVDEETRVAKLDIARHTDP